MTTFNDILIETNAMLGNRNDVLTYTTFPTVATPQDSDRLVIWMKDAYIEICMAYRFEELEEAITDNFVQGQDVYTFPTSTQGAPGTRMLRCLTLIFPLLSGNSEPRPIRRRHIRNIRRYQTSSQGPPAIYAPYNPGGAPGIIVRPVPDRAYQRIWDIMDLPTIEEPIATTPILLPLDWVDILKWSTVLRGHTALVERDKAGEVQTLLFGGYDPKLGRKVPGMINQRLASRDQADIEDTEFGLQPLTRRYSNTP